ncbi:MAG: efflux RND transporter periplasmic adaptor subunit, partial [Rhodoplanes sp.]
RLESAIADLAVVEGAARVAEQRLIQAELRVKSEQATLASSEAALDQAKVRAEDAAISLRRIKELARNGDVAQIDLERASSTAETAASEMRAAEARRLAARSSLRTAEAGIQVAQGELENNQITVQSRQLSVAQLKKDLEATKIRSPIDGLVIERAAVPGQLVKAGDLLFKLWDPNQPILLHSNINEADIGRVEIGQRAHFSFPAFPERQFEGKIVNVRKVPINIQNVISYTVVVEADAGVTEVFPGMSADLSIVTARRNGVVKIPVSAIRFRPQAEDLRKAAKRERAAHPRVEVVWVVDGSGRPHPVDVRIGIADAQFAEVLEGEVAEGDQVVVGIAGAEEASGRRWFRF